MRTACRRAACLAFALLAAVSACTNQGAGRSATSADAIPAALPDSHWDLYGATSAGSKKLPSTGIAASDRGAAMLVACEDDGYSPQLLVTPDHPLPGKVRDLWVDVIFDDGQRLLQSWIASSTGYGIAEDAIGFSSLIEALKRHPSVELVLKDNGRVLDRRRFSLVGAGAAIDKVLAACHDRAAKTGYGNVARADRWTVNAALDGVGEEASVAAEEGGAFLYVTCDKGGFKHPAAVLIINGKMQDWPEAHNLMIAYDGGKPVAQPWLPREFDGGHWGFIEQAPAIDLPVQLVNLKAHRRVEMVARRAGKDEVRVHFTLNGAAEAIDRVMGACPLPEPKLPKATSTRWGSIETGGGYIQPTAGILRDDGSAALEVTCNRNRRAAGILVWPPAALSGSGTPASPALGFDGAAPEAMNWTGTAGAFDLWNGDAQFGAVMQRLIASRRVAMVFRAPDGHETREEFLLANVRAAIAPVLAACDLPLEP
jgi:hypothetical protein